MFRQVFSIAILGCAVTVTACAKKPESIAPTYVSHVQYSTWRCDQLAEESARLHAALATASQQQSNARENDIAGIIFLGVPVSSLSGDNVAPQIANYKGQIVAVSQAASHKGCTLPPPPPVQQTAKKDEFNPF